MTDAQGGTVPEHLEVDFACIEAFDKAARALRRAAALLKIAEASSAYRSVAQRTPADTLFSSACFTAASKLDRWKPHIVCPTCEGTGCTSCKQKGYLTKGESNEIPK